MVLACCHSFPFFWGVGLASIGGHACVLHPSLTNLSSVAAPNRTRPRAAHRTPLSGGGERPEARRSPRCGSDLERKRLLQHRPEFSGERKGRFKCLGDGHPTTEASREFDVQGAAPRYAPAALTAMAHAMVVAGCCAGQRPRSVRSLSHCGTASRDTNKRGGRV